jgi:predicted MFS family arabinose efflux permease
MWELYALWAWMASFFIASRQAETGAAPGVTETGLTVFAATGLAGLAGSVAAGRLADRIRRAATAGGAMILSGACCLTSPLAFASSRAVLLGLLTIWGAAVIADSAHFSAAETELAEPRYAGSILALQLALGFALTAGSIRLVPAVVGGLGWQLALLPRAIGPLLGTVAMLRLRDAGRQLPRERAQHQRGRTKLRS